MIGPRKRAAGAAPPATAVGNRSRPAAIAARSRSRSRSDKAGKSKTGSKASDRKDKDKKEFAWMDSDSESEKAKAAPKKGKAREASPASSAGRSRSKSVDIKPVPLNQVETLSQMARLAPDLEKRLKDGRVRPRELMEVIAAISRSKFFDGGMFEVLADELRRAFKHRDLSAMDTVDAVCVLADLNAYNSRMFEAACEFLQRDISKVEVKDRQRLEVAFKRVDHKASEDFLQSLRQKKPGDGREACPMFFRGQCKWGPKCKLSHDADSFDGTVDAGKWKAPSQTSHGKSVGFKQSNDMFKADRTGALW